MRGTPTRIASPPLRVMLMVCSMVGPRPITSKATSAPRPPREADHVGDRVALVGLHEVGGAELLGHLELRLEHVDGDDLLGAGDLGALDHVEADAAAADHGDRVALADAGGVERGADAGEHAAADEGGVAEVDVVVDLHERDLGDDGVVAERAAHGHLPQRLAVEGEAGGAVEHAAGGRHRALLAEEALAAVAVVAGRRTWARTTARRGRRAASDDTPSPTSSTMPAPSWPSTMGGGSGMVPFWTDRSEWHTPEATIFTLHSPGPGGAISMSSWTWTSSPTPFSTAAVTIGSPCVG